MLPEEKARKRIDVFLDTAGWTIASREDFTPIHPTAFEEALMLGNTESDYLLFIDGKAIAVLEAKREENELKRDVETQAEQYVKDVNLRKVMSYIQKAEPQVLQL